MTTNRYSMMDAFTPEEFSVLYDLVMFHDADECPEWMDATVRDKVLEKVSDVMTEYNKGAAWWPSQSSTSSLPLLLFLLLNLPLITLPVT